MPQQKAIEQLLILITLISGLGMVLVKFMSSISYTTMPLIILDKQHFQNHKTQECGQLWEIAMKRWINMKKPLNARKEQTELRTRKQQRCISLQNFTFKLESLIRLQHAFKTTWLGKIKRTFKQMRPQKLLDIQQTTTKAGWNSEKPRLMLRDYLTLVALNKKKPRDS